MNCVSVCVGVYVCSRTLLLTWRRRSSIAPGLLITILLTYASDMLILSFGKTFSAVGEERLRFRQIATRSEKKKKKKEWPTSQSRPIVFFLARWICSTIIMHFYKFRSEMLDQFCHHDCVCSNGMLRIARREKSTVENNYLHRWNLDWYDF